MPELPAKLGSTLQQVQDKMAVASVLDTKYFSAGMRVLVTLMTLQMLIGYFLLMSWGVGTFPSIER